MQKNERPIFCCACRQEVNYTVKQETETAEFRGEKYEFSVRNAYCDQCGGEVYVAELEDTNLKEFNEAYRRKSRK